MEDSGVRSRNTAQEKQGNADRRELLSTKPLHRFVQKEPKSLGIVLLMFGCAEFLAGFLMSGHGFKFKISNYVYTPFWQGALFTICGSLSIYTGIHPSKKMVTVCLCMYVVSLMGVIVSSGFRIWSMIVLDLNHRHPDSEWLKRIAELLTGIEAVLFVSSLCVFVLLIFLCVVARLALKSTRTQIVLHQIPPPVTETPTE
ncbi:membrane-spanning 4-domains subfamily A member 4D-like [Periophthalmus magnuspinnatus]|uniref:membrane-spanning 4-domains subfamily A member 4D-like n=1 Tax=Periophthalmus magnuspinnatus TaxID=409849 RepID=UPI00145A7CFF|nr:membrane-spanning 4-domains subfamily A member 4D-like [Periophthalmus magnuspinnatus]XP_055080741.1 membrane-spanning 4-domains subfamily A member 4D-like [Periophthalmus magnuspinnatus]